MTTSSGVQQNVEGTGCLVVTGETENLVLFPKQRQTSLVFLKILLWAKPKMCAFRLLLECSVVKLPKRCILQDFLLGFFFCFSGVWVFFSVEKTH